MKGWKGTNPWDKYKALGGKGIPRKAESSAEAKKEPKIEPKAEDRGGREIERPKASANAAPVPQAATPPASPPAPSLEADAQGALSQATKANPPKQWDQPGGPAAPDMGTPPAPEPSPTEAKQPSPSGQDLGNPPSLPNKADRPFSAKEIAQIMKDAKAAIAKGAPRDKVVQRLKENGLDPSGLDENG